MTLSTVIRPFLDQLDDLPQGEAFFKMGFDSWRPLFPIAIIFWHRAKSSPAPWDKYGARGARWKMGNRTYMSVLFGTLL